MIAWGVGGACTTSPLPTGVHLSCHGGCTRYLLETSCCQSNLVTTVCLNDEKHLKNNTTLPATAPHHPAAAASDSPTTSRYTIPIRTTQPSAWRAMGHDAGVQASGAGTTRGQARGLARREYSHTPARNTNPRRCDVPTGRPCRLPAAARGGAPAPRRTRSARRCATAPLGAYSSSAQEEDFDSLVFSSAFSAVGSGSALGAAPVTGEKGVL